MIYHDKEYVRLDRALYGTIEAVKVWYNTLSTYLMKIGFRANPRDEYVFNIDYKGRQMTILLHVDDLMISCENQSGIDYVITSLNMEYSRANVYDTLTLDYRHVI